MWLRRTIDTTVDQYKGMGDKAPTYTGRGFGSTAIGKFDRAQLPVLECSTAGEARLSERGMARREDMKKRVHI